MLLAVVLDRLSQAAAARAASAAVLGAAPRLVARSSALAAAILAVTTALSPYVPALQGAARSFTVTTAPIWDFSIRWITVISSTSSRRAGSGCCSIAEAGEVVPAGAALAREPDPADLAGYRLGGRRLALLIALLTAACVVFGLWDKVMTTLYLCAVSTIIACAIGLPSASLAARMTADRIVTVGRHLQTIPAFVYLIPA